MELIRSEIFLIKGGPHSPCAVCVYVYVSECVCVYRSADMHGCMTGGNNSVTGLLEKVCVGLNYNRLSDPTYREITQTQ